MVWTSLRVSSLSAVVAWNRPSGPLHALLLQAAEQVGADAGLVVERLPEAARLEEDPFGAQVLRRQGHDPDLHVQGPGDLVEADASLRHCPVSDIHGLAARRMTGSQSRSACAAALLRSPDQLMKTLWAAPVPVPCFPLIFRHAAETSPGAARTQGFTRRLI